MSFSALSNLDKTFGSTALPKAGGTMTGNLNLVTGGTLVGPHSTSNAPSYNWSADTTTGLYSPALSNIGFATAGKEALRIVGSNVGVGNSNPAYRLDVNGYINSTRTIANGTTTNSNIDAIPSSIAGAFLQGSGGSNVFFGGDIYGDNGFAWGLDTADTDASGYSKLKLTTGAGAGTFLPASARITIPLSGKVGIGTTSPVLYELLIVPPLTPTKPPTL